MNDKLQEIFENLVPYIVLGVFIALIVGLLFMFSYVLIWGLVIGGVLWVISIAKNYFFPDESTKKEQGRIIEHDDTKK